MKNVPDNIDENISPISKIKRGVIAMRKYDLDDMGPMELKSSIRMMELRLTSLFGALLFTSYLGYKEIISIEITPLNLITLGFIMLLINLLIANTFDLIRAFSKRIDIYEGFHTAIIEEEKIEEN